MHFCSNSSQPLPPRSHIHSTQLTQRYLGSDTRHVKICSRPLDAGSVRREIAKIVDAPVSCGDCGATGMGGDDAR